MILLIPVAAFAAAWFTYVRLEDVGRRALWPLLSRAAAWAALGVLLVNVACPATRTPGRPLVLLDGSLSMQAAGGKWAAARDAAGALGDVRYFGDDRPRADTLPVRGRSRLAPALAAAVAAARPVVVVTDGEIDDRAELAPDLLAGIGVRLFRRDTVPDAAITALSGPTRATVGDTLRLEVEVSLRGGLRMDTVPIAVALRQQVVGRAKVRVAGGLGRATVPVPTAALPPGQHVLRVALVAGGDREPRDDARLHVITLTCAPGLVLLAAPPDWDSRFLYRTLKTVAQLPLRGYVRIADRWRAMDDLRPVTLDEVRQAANGADVLILKGGAETVAGATRARGIWRWPSGENGATVTPGDWYLSVGASSPLAGSFGGVLVDSLPPAAQLTTLEPAPDAWVALVAQEGRRGPPRPAVIGRQLPTGRRELLVGVDGLWRWAFRGGAADQAYRAFVGDAVSWLLGAADSSRGRAGPVRAVAQNGRPIVFQWLAAAPATPVEIVWQGPSGTTRDTLRFGGSGRAEAWLAPGEYRYRMADGATGTVAVEEYSDELLPRPVVLAERPMPAPPASRRGTARDQLWLFALAITALASEWLGRRRLGLR